MSSIIVINKPYRDDKAISNVINYMIEGTSDNDKNFITNEDCVCYGINPLSLQTVVNSFELDQRINGKDFGIKIHHFILSIYKPNYFNTVRKKNWASLLSEDVGYYLKSKGYRNVSCIHVTHEGYVHIHFAVNPVNVNTGNKLKNTKSFYNDLLHFLRINYDILKWEGVIY